MTKAKTLAWVAVDTCGYPLGIDERVVDAVTDARERGHKSERDPLCCPLRSTFAISEVHAVLRDCN